MYVWNSLTLSGSGGDRDKPSISNFRFRPVLSDLELKAAVGLQHNKPHRAPYCSLYPQTLTDGLWSLSLCSLSRCAGCAAKFLGYYLRRRLHRSAFPQAHAHMRVVRVMLVMLRSHAGHASGGITGSTSAFLVQMTPWRTGGSSNTFETSKVGRSALTTCRGKAQ